MFVVLEKRLSGPKLSVADPGFDLGAWTLSTGGGRRKK